MASTKLGGPTGAASENTYVTRPPFKSKFNPKVVLDVLKSVLAERLKDKIYHPENASNWSREIADEIKIKIKDLDYQRYKIVVQVVIGEQRGEGIKMGCRCFWDADTDNYIEHVYSNETLFCVAAAFGGYYP
eukprot:comp22763_c0_seq1/m.57880 comp22763_c0_seq1/g.57880  ORF comp22763_c0_seq1/g.57880 comp22763_c0_seq1/m.57880 type:complete len:132 (+) comp22763_c0_seq1:246-641(+)